MQHPIVSLVGEGDGVCMAFFGIEPRKPSGAVQASLVKAVSGFAIASHELALRYAPPFLPFPSHPCAGVAALTGRSRPDCPSLVSHSHPVFFSCVVVAGAPFLLPSHPISCDCQIRSGGAAETKSGLGSRAAARHPLSALAPPPTLPRARCPPEVDAP
jgi:hypothetical protein